MEDLQYLNIFDNEFSGEIPSEIGNLTNLVQFRLHDNNFTGLIPETICGLSFDFSSWEFGLENNKFCPPYPPCISLEDIDSQDTSDCEESLLGDLNLDDAIDIVDIVMLVNIVLNGGTYYSAGDLNFDGLNNVVDIVALVDKFLTN